MPKKALKQNVVHLIRAYFRQLATSNKKLISKEYCIQLEYDSNETRCMYGLGIR